jgi:hypothetical protein
LDFELGSIAHLGVEAKEDEVCRATSWPVVVRANRPTHLARVDRGGFVIVRRSEPTGVSHPSGSLQVLYKEERLAVVRQCLELRLPSPVWIAQVCFLDHITNDEASGCSVWSRNSEAEYVLLSQIYRSTHCVHLCSDDTCFAEVGADTALCHTVRGGMAVGLVGSHTGCNTLFLLNEHFLR